MQQASNEPFFGKQAVWSEETGIGAVLFAFPLSDTDIQRSLPEKKDPKIEVMDPELEEILESMIYI